MSTTDPHHDRLNTLKLDQRDLEALDARFCESHPDQGTRGAREHTRFEFRKTLILFEIVHPDGNVVRLPVVSRNLSRQGIALMHSAYVHVGSECNVCIAYPPHKWIRVPGKVCRCEHREGTTHELGIRFDEPIDARDILSLDPMSGEWTREHVDPSRLRGRVLVLDTDDLVHRLIDGLLKQADLEILHAYSPEEALGMASGCDLILCEYHLEGSTGAEFTSTLKGSGFPIPVLLMTGDKTERVREEMRAAGAAGFVSKPLSGNTLHRALAEYMFEDVVSDNAHSSLPEGDPRTDLLEPFVSSLVETASRIEQGVESDDHGACLTVCRELAGQAPSLGFEDLGRVADEAMTRLLACESVKEATRELAHLVGACRLTKLKPPAEKNPESEGAAGDNPDAPSDDPPVIAEPADTSASEDSTEEPPMIQDQAA